ncbi:hypothetical protein ES703_50596 [subsurface metagenome]
MEIAIHIINVIAERIDYDNRQVGLEALHVRVELYVGLADNGAWHQARLVCSCTNPGGLGDRERGGIWRAAGGRLTAVGCVIDVRG